MNNLLGLLIAYVYVFTVIGLAEGLRRWRGYSNVFTRKFIHIGVGMLSWLIPFIFTSPWPFVFASLSFALLNIFDWRYGYFSSMASGSRSNLGTVYFPIAAAVVALIFWNEPPLLVAALMPLTWGDGLASVIGKSYGTNTYVIFGHKRSLQGSTGFIIFGGFFTWLALWLVPGAPQITAFEAFAPAVVVITTSALAEAVSPWGLDNLIIPAVSVLVLSLWSF